MSKRVWNHPEVPAEEQGTKVWRSASELEGNPLFQDWLHREFPEKNGELTEEERELSRRSFVKLMGASSALAGLGLASCRRPETYIVPYREAPEWIIPGKALYYATTMPRAGGAVPLVATTFEGRPTKLEPNNDVSGEIGTDAFTQASILDLYDPFRSKDVLFEGKKSSRAELDSALSGLAKDAGKVGFVFGEDDSPTRNRMVQELQKKFPQAKAYRYEALQSHASEEVLGAGVRPVVDFSKAARILSFDCDFTELDQVGALKGFYDKRQGGSHEGDDLYAHEVKPEKMNRLYQVEAAYSLTGGIADHRLRIAPSQYLKIAVAVAKAVGAQVAGDAQLTEEQAKWVKACAEDLKANAGKSVVLAGTRESKALHEVVAAINLALGNVGAEKPLSLKQTGTKDFTGLTELVKDLEAGAIETLVMLTPGDPVYDAPADIDFKGLLAKVKTSIHWGLRTNATAYASTWHIPAAHYLESWADAKSKTGTHLLAQPLILPLYDGVGEFELLSAFLADGQLNLGDEKTPAEGYDQVRKTFEAAAGKDAATWAKALRDGFVEATYPEAALPSVSPAPGDALQAPVPTKDSLDVVFAADASVWDGRYIENSWLQEAPDPQSKLTWDNIAYISPKTADALGISKELVTLQPENNVAGFKVENAPRPEIGEGEKARAYMVDLTLGDKKIKMPVLVAFGLAENTIILPVGYGQGADDGRSGAAQFNKSQPRVGDVGLNSGFDVYPLRSMATPWFAAGATVAKNSGRYPVALTQEHHAMYGRALAREISTATVETKGHGSKDYKTQLKKVAKQGMDSHMPKNHSIYKPNDTEGKPLISDEIHQWAMAIDLNVCTGCNACLIACQAENNIPVVGKEQVAKGREMHWIRMDRYYAATPDGDEDNPEMIPQPVACQQCELAPCEVVCPVNATVHTEEGLNAMAYNRCIGTRYCANNCPYKARRFNFFDYNKRNPLVKDNLYKGPWGEKQEGDSRHLQRNPNVSVRMRGVMEKCTYCVQRLENAKIKQKQITRKKSLGKDSTTVKVSSEDLRIKVDSVKVACQSACSASAITFGNKLDGDQSAMVRAKNSKRNYDLLNYIGALPRTSYLARVKNPNTAMPDAKSVGQATINIH